MNITENLRNLRQRISDIEKTYNRKPGSVTLLAVSKKQAALQIREAYLASQHCFGENYLQEAITKKTALQDLNIEWHFIGSVQANKTKEIAENFSWLHSLDRIKVAQRLSVQRPPSLPPLNVCIGVNISEEASKSGVSLSELQTFISEVSTIERLRVRGLMVIPEPTDDKEKQHAIYQQVVIIQNKLIQKGFELDTFSMGMTHDFEAAIAAGSTIVRIGTAIFGKRT